MVRRVTLAALAASIIGCGSPESNSPQPAAAPQNGVAQAPSGEPPTVRNAAVTEAPSGTASGTASEAPSATPETVLFIGTSLTAGLGVPLERSFPLLIERKIEEAGLPYRVVNAGVSGETSAGARSRIGWLLRQPFDVAVVETGANDMLRGVDPAVSEANIQAIIDQLRDARPQAQIVLVGMLALPNLGPEYARRFEAIYPRLAERNDVALVPFLLDGVGGVRELNQSDGVHPNEAGHEIIAETVWQVLEPVLRMRELAPLARP